MQIFAVIAATVASIAAQIARIGASDCGRGADLRSIASVLCRSRRCRGRAGFPATVAPNRGVGAKVSLVAAKVATVAAKIATVGANVARVAGATSPDRSGATAAARPRSSKHRRKASSPRRVQSICCEASSKSSRDRWARDRDPRAIRGGRRAGWRHVKASPYLAFREKDGIVPRRAGPTRFRGRVRCDSRAYAHIEGAVTALPTPSSPMPSVPPAAQCPAAPVGPPAPLEFPLSWLLEFAPPPIQYRAAIEVARLPLNDLAELLGASLRLSSPPLSSR